MGVPDRQAVAYVQQFRMDNMATTMEEVLKPQSTVFVWVVVLVGLVCVGWVVGPVWGPGGSVGRVFGA